MHPDNITNTFHTSVISLTGSYQFQMSKLKKEKKVKEKKKRKRKPRHLKIGILDIFKTKSSLDETNFFATSHL